MPEDPSLHELAQTVVQKLTAAGKAVATAESCTGGWIAKCCTDLAGSSAWFERGFVTYSDAAKHDLLGVDAQVLEFAGAVFVGTKGRLHTTGHNATTGHRAATDGRSRRSERGQRKLPR